MNTKGGSPEARRAKEGASADSAEEMKDTTTIWRRGFMQKLSAERAESQALIREVKRQRCPKIPLMPESSSGEEQESL